MQITQTHLSNIFKIGALFVVLGLLIYVSMALLQDTALAKQCGSADTSIISCGTGENTDPIMYVLKLAIQIMTVGVGVLAIGAFVYAGILYASAGGAQEQVKKAKDMIRNTVIGLLLFIFLFALTNFLIPGGILS